MDFLDPAKKRAHIIRLFIGYGLIAIAVAITALILLYQSFGYDVDRTTGKVIQNGLLFVAAHPESASIYLNGELNKSKTDARLPIPAGQYSLELKRDGYRPWKRLITLDGGSIQRVEYPILFPEKLTTTDVQLYSSVPAMATSSLDHKWLLVQTPDSVAQFDNFDLTNPSQPPTTLTIPATTLTAAAGAQSLTAIEWSNDNRHLLMSHNFDGQSEFILVDREVPANSININTLTSTAPTKVTLLDKRNDQLLVYDAKTLVLQKYDVKAKTLVPVLQNVTSYVSSGPDFILYTSGGGTASPGLVIVRIWDGNASYDIHTYPAGTTVRLDLAQYNSNWYTAVAPSGTGRTFIYKNPHTTLKLFKNKMLVPTSILKLDEPNYVSMSGNGQFVLAEKGSKFGVYDIETDKRFYFDTKQAVAADQHTDWLDNFHLSMTIDGHLQVFDFDGANLQTLTANTFGFQPFTSRDNNTLFNIAPSVVVPGRPALTSTKLKL